MVARNYNFTKQNGVVKKASGRFTKQNGTVKRIWRGWTKRNGVVEKVYSLLPEWASLIKVELPQKITTPTWCDANHAVLPLMLGQPTQIIRYEPDSLKAEIESTFNGNSSVFSKFYFAGGDVSKQALLPNAYILEVSLSTLVVTNFSNLNIASGDVNCKINDTSYVGMRINTPYEGNIIARYYTTSKITDMDTDIPAGRFSDNGRLGMRDGVMVALMAETASSGVNCAVIYNNSVVVKVMLPSGISVSASAQVYTDNGVEAFCEARLSGGSGFLKINVDTKEVEFVSASGRGSLFGVYNGSLFATQNSNITGLRIQKYAKDGTLVKEYTIPEITDMYSMRFQHSGRYTGLMQEFDGYKYNLLLVDLAKL